MKPEDLETMFVKAASDLQDAKSAAMESGEAAITAKLTLEYAKRITLLEGKIKGSNEAARDIEYHNFCAEQYAILKDLEARNRRDCHILELAQIDYDLARYLLRVQEIVNSRNHAPHIPS
jgi:hypothetical protein